ncbi:MAG: GGDEF domain-containing phosphodiesterase [Gallionella sp.]|nr:EAL domain-containing protein [Gallionella sp.]
MSQHLLSHSKLIAFLQQQFNSHSTKSMAVLMIELHRTDRLEVVTGRISSQSIQQYIDDRLGTLLRDADRFAHVGDEQILLALPNLANKDHSVLAAIKIIAELKKPVIMGAYSIQLRPYIGIANFPDTARNSNQLLMYADIALKAAATNENGFYVYEAQGAVEPKAYVGLEIELGKAIKANELRVNFQPKMDIKTGSCISAEALVRWTAPWGEEVNPSLLVDTAEDTGLINPLTLWILNTALRHAANFAKAGANIGISVNLPPKVLEDEELPQIIQQTLSIWNIPAKNLTLEVTESSMIKNIEPAITMLTKLRALGINLSIDDFGTGYSSLAYLKRLPVQELKIDRLFISNLKTDTGDQKLVRSIIDLAHNFDLTTVAEGVEDQATFDLLKAFGCDIAQGFLFSKALPEEAFIDWFRAHG